jgi:hypothetical protein
VETFTYHIDIVGSCNLRCPSCPVGNSPDVPHAKGLMPLDLYKQILDKIIKECPYRPIVNLYNWAEPFLHPQLPEFVRVARDLQLPVGISSNLNISRNIDEVVRAEPRVFRVTVSGFTQEVYSRVQPKGDIETVKANMLKIREARERCGSKTPVHLIYLCYLHNMGDEYDNMRALSAELGFRFAPCWAYLMGPERYIEWYEDGPTEKDQALIDLLIVQPDRAREIALRHMPSDCVMRSRQSAINCDGSVALCCGAYDSTHDIAVSFLEASHESLQEAKYQHPLCEKCMKHGIHLTAKYVGIREWNAIAAERLKPQRVPKELLPPTLAKRLVPTFAKRALRKMLLMLHPG